MPLKFHLKVKFLKNAKEQVHSNNQHRPKQIFYLPAYVLEHQKNLSMFKYLLHSAVLLTLDIFFSISKQLILIFLKLLIANKI